MRCLATSVHALYLTISSLFQHSIICKGPNTIITFILQDQGLMKIQQGNPKPKSKQPIRSAPRAGRKPRVNCQPTNSGVQIGSNHDASRQSIYYSDQEADSSNKGQLKLEELSEELRQASERDGEMGSKNWIIPNLRGAVAKGKKIQKKQLTKGVLANQTSKKTALPRELKNLALEQTINKVKKAPEQPLQPLTKVNQAPAQCTNQNRARISTRQNARLIKKQEQLINNQLFLKQPQIKSEQSQNLNQKDDSFDKIDQNSKLQQAHEESIKEEPPNQRGCMRIIPNTIQEQTQKTDSPQQQQKIEQQPKQKQVQGQLVKKKNLVIKTELKDHPAYTQLDGDNMLSNQQKFRIFQRIRELNQQAKSQSRLYKKTKKQRQQKISGQAWAQNQKELAAIIDSSDVNRDSQSKVLSVIEPNQVPVKQKKDQIQYGAQFDLKKWQPIYYPSRHRRVEILDRYKYNPFEEEPRADQCLMWKNIMEFIIKKDLSPHFKHTPPAPIVIRREVPKKFSLPLNVKIQDFLIPTLFEPATNSLKIANQLNQQKNDCFNANQCPSNIKSLNNSSTNQLSNPGKAIKIQNHERIREDATQNRCQIAKESQQGGKATKKPKQNSILNPNSPPQRKKNESSEQESEHPSELSFSFNLLQDFDVPSKMKEGQIQAEMEEIKSNLKKDGAKSQELDVI